MADQYTAFIPNEARFISHFGHKHLITLLVLARNTFSVVEVHYAVVEVYYSNVVDAYCTNVIKVYCTTVRKEYYTNDYIRWDIGSYFENGSSCIVTPTLS